MTSSSLCCVAVAVATAALVLLAQQSVYTIATSITTTTHTPTPTATKAAEQWFDIKINPGSDRRHQANAQQNTYNHNNAWQAWNHPPPLSRQPATVEGPLVLTELANECFETDTSEYTYKLCMFHNITQTNKAWSSTPVVIGIWGHYGTGTEMEVEGGGGVHHRAPYTTMVYTDGNQCSNGAKRKTTVTLECDTSARLATPAEPHPCEYSLVFYLPGVCDPEHMVLPSATEAAAATATATATAANTATTTATAGHAAAVEPPPSSLSSVLSASARSGGHMMVANNMDECHTHLQESLETQHRMQMCVNMLLALTVHPERLHETGHSVEVCEGFLDAWQSPPPPPSSTPPPSSSSPPSPTTTAVPVVVPPVTTSMNAHVQMEVLEASTPPPPSSPPPPPQLQPQAEAEAEPSSLPSTHPPVAVVAPAEFAVRGRPAAAVAETTGRRRQQTRQRKRKKRRRRRRRHRYRKDDM